MTRILFLLLVIVVGVSITIASGSEDTPFFNPMTNSEEVAAFVSNQGPPPAWQWNGKEWDYTGGKFLTEAYQKQLEKVGYKVKFIVEQGTNTWTRN